MGYGIWDNGRSYWNINWELGKHVGNLMEHIGNNNQKIQHPHPTPKMKKTWNPWVHINSIHWVQEL
jgi:hypothetical protein